MCKYKDNYRGTDVPVRIRSGVVQIQVESTGLNGVVRIATKHRERRTLKPYMGEGPQTPYYESGLQDNAAPMLQRAAEAALSRFKQKAPARTE